MGKMKEGIYYEKEICIHRTISMFVLLHGCLRSTTSESPAEANEDSGTEEVSEKNGLSAEKNLLSVEGTIPASLLDGSVSTELTDEAKSHGIKDITQNEDGSITMNMGKEAHQELLDSVKASIDDTIHSILTDKENYSSFDSITYNDNVTVFDVNVDPATYGGLQSLSALSFYVIGNMYQALNAVPENELKTVVNFVNKDTGEVIESGDSTALEDFVSETE